MCSPRHRLDQFETIQRKYAGCEGDHGSRGPPRAPTAAHSRATPPQGASRTPRSPASPRAPRARHPPPTRRLSHSVLFSERRKKLCGKKFNFANSTPLSVLSLSLSLSLALSLSTLCAGGVPGTSSVLSPSVSVACPHSRDSRFVFETRISSLEFPVPLYLDDRWWSEIATGHALHRVSHRRSSILSAPRESRRNLTSDSSSCEMSAGRWLAAVSKSYSTRPLRTSSFDALRVRIRRFSSRDSCCGESQSIARESGSKKRFLPCGSNRPSRVVSAR